MKEGALGTLYAAGDDIVTQGEVGHCMYVVQSGEVEVLHEGKRGVKRLAVLRAGEFFGEMSVFEQEVRSATVRALGDARVMKVDKKTLLRRIKEDPLLAVTLLQTLSRRVRDLNDQLSSFTGSTHEGKE